ncbi:MAG: hypothetical protein N2738_07920, partial [Thermodesulfovibrionales bacterium]|nr:hypothetical protein [Thermodesulfovibrionales bacterium]
FGILKEIKVSGLIMERFFYVLTHNKRTLLPNYAVFVENLCTLFDDSTNQALHLTISAESDETQH